VNFRSTRGRASAVPFAEAITAGLAPDGGLYVPERFPEIDAATFDGQEPLARLAPRFLAPFLEDDVLAPHLVEICQRAFDFPVPLIDLPRGTAVLELFRGPTAAFKDFGARFLAGCFERLIEVGASPRPMTILVATSGDTGAAVAAAFHRKRGIRVAILFPDGGVSPRQERHLTCWDDNIASFAVQGSFDDCQRLVKQAFQDDDCRRAAHLTSANSINIGRLLPQAAYYAASAVSYRLAHDRVPRLVVPAGNLGNAVGAFWARQVGFPIGHIALATNDNRTVPDWFRSGRWQPRPSVATLANAMDVGDPSNMERLFDLYPEREAFLEGASALAVDDATIRRVIAEGPARWGRVFCPHTATAVHFREQLEGEDWILAATAHPAKFESIVEPLIGRPLVLPLQLAEMLERPTRVTRINPELGDLRAWIVEM
jgi:threonine synthase